MKKIMFNDKYGLTDAVLNGTKTMTRRMVSVPEYWHGVWVWGFAFDGQSHSLLLYDADERPMEDPDTGECAYILPKYKIGEVVAVAQSYLSIHEEMMNGDYSNYIYDTFRWAEVDNKKGWNNKMFVLADLMPHQIRITNIKVERLQDISDEDCMREGITMMTEGKIEIGNAYGWDTKIDALKRESFFTPKSAFAALIDRVSGKGTWESNPFCFCYEFKLVK